MPPAPPRAPPPSQPVVRCVVVSNVLVGAVSVAVGVALLVLAWRMGHAKVATLLVALVGAGGGAALLGRPFARVCAQCRVPLRLVGVRFDCRDARPALAALRVGDARAALGHLGPPDRRGDAWAELWHCPACRSVAALRLSGEEGVLTGAAARELVDRVAPAPAEEG